jgi:hypothetical protein
LRRKAHDIGLADEDVVGLRGKTERQLGRVGIADPPDQVAGLAEVGERPHEPAVHRPFPLVPLGVGSAVVGTGSHAHR